MGLTVITEDDHGDSHFVDSAFEYTAAPFAPPAPPLELAAPVEPVRAVFIRSPHNWFGDWHPSPCRQYYVHTAGVLEIEVSDGEVRQFHAGDVALIEDLRGKGHRSRVLGDEPVLGVFLQLTD